MPCAEEDAGNEILKDCRERHWRRQCYAGRMVHRQIELDEESDRILTELAGDYNGDLGQALGDLLHSHEVLEVFAAESEEAQGESLASQKERSERGFRAGRFVTWAEVKRQNGL